MIWVFQGGEGPISPSSPLHWCLVLCEAEMSRWMDRASLGDKLDQEGPHGLKALLLECSGLSRVCPALSTHSFTSGLGGVSPPQDPTPSSSALWPGHTGVGSLAH